MTRKTRKNRQNRKPKVNWQKECETAIILDELLHPPTVEEVDEDRVGLSIEEYEIALYLKELRDYIGDYVEEHPIPHDYTLEWHLSPVYYLDNDFE